MAPGLAPGYTLKIVHCSCVASVMLFDTFRPGWDRLDSHCHVFPVVKCPSPNYHRLARRRVSIEQPERRKAEQLQATHQRGAVAPMHDLRVLDDWPTTYPNESRG